MEQQRLVQLLVARVYVAKRDVQVLLRAEGLGTLARELKEIGKGQWR
ncbi:MAG: hypothetical protein H7839_11815 [Magnetococcus sp. YQC-5]